MKHSKFAAVLLFFSFIIVSSTFVSCEDDEGGSIPARLVGTWHGTGSRVNYYVTFKADHTYTCHGDKSWGTYYQSEGTYSVSGSTIQCKGYFIFLDDGQNGQDKTQYQYHGTYLTGGQNSSVQKYEKQ